MYKQPVPVYIKEREEAAAQPSDTKTYFDPGAFNWFEPQKTKGEPFITIKNDSMYISVEACKLAGLNAGDRISIGVNKKMLAIRKSEHGFRLYGKRGGSLVCSIKRLPGDVKEKINGRTRVDWDGNMLVGKRPEGGVGDGEA